MAESLRLYKPAHIRLAGHPEFNEAWLQDEIVRDPTMLGIGSSVYVAAREVRQPQGGRLDLLMIDRDEGTRYEVELMLGDTDPSHIIRCIEYWDVERKRYPKVEHVAVLVAENITSRFLNVIGLFNAVIPIVAIQLNALRVDDKIVLNFTKVLDLTAQPEDDDSEGVKTVSREDWDSWASPDSMRLVDTCFELLSEITSGRSKPSYKQGYIGIMLGNTVDNFVTFHPKKAHVRIHLNRVGDTDELKARLEAQGIPVLRASEHQIACTATMDQLTESRAAYRDAFAECFQGRWSKGA